MRQKKVFSTDEVPHLWAHQTQDDARNSQSNLFFEGGTIYSYGKHFPIARHVTNGRGEKAILFNSGRYSVTTARHIHMVRMSIPSDAQVFHVDGKAITEQWNRSFESSLQDYAEQIPKLLLEAKRARASWSKDSANRRAAEMHAEALAFCAFHDLDASGIASLGIDLSALEASLRTDKKREREEAKARQQRRMEEQAEAIAGWREGKRGAWSFDAHSIPTMLRVNGDTVETSRGASFPVEHARKGLTLVRAVMARGEEWRTNGHTCHLGHYRIDRITANGTVYAGCHVVTWEEIKRISFALQPFISCQTCGTPAGNATEKETGICHGCKEGVR